MARFWPILLFIAIFIFVWLQPEKPQLETNGSEISSPQRVISLAPSITETLFALDAGDKVVAVTDYCQYPNQVKKLPKVGGYLDPNLEQIVRLKADIVILLERQQSLNRQLQQLGIQTLSIDNSSLNGIRNSIIDIGSAVNKVSSARHLVSEFDNRLEAIKQKVRDQPEPTVLLAIAHSSHTDFLDKVYIAGQQDFYNDLLSFVGAKNVFHGPNIKVPAVSTEGLLRLNPQIIVDIFPGEEVYSPDLTKLRQQWQRLDKMDAISNKQLHIIQADYAVIPGPRIIQLAEDLARIFHPQLDWDSSQND
ncbi:MAG TPA: ABC transporter substrate-binding protein [Methylophaga sp.]|jgi:iron complex transport system substrate-binding protein|uniref:ABC transporter substrate-binding protein n=1 Tax=unclassified Methylophaga TaxID=2629249 RepID=UPI000ED1AD1F|nr:MULTISPECIES: ABC transporter substrate-binding protein [unclassified Methylophaga]HAD32753.1 ABC transporter substrate-binding protein [Methylophaga sp.]HCO01460.1 ABC transporter substrate-binding protein [Methylophaga sp.]|tara:strand:- start:1405 stop:2322 length:918 start_codon:yes stop_codon:yes gene_type:complete